MIRPTRRPCDVHGPQAPHTRSGCIFCRQRARKPVARGKAPRKQRKSTVAALKRKLWGLFAAYVKERDGAKCVTCGKEPLVGSDWHAGHWISRRVSSTLFHPLNVASQCGAPCNMFRRGAPHEFADYLLEKYGPDQVRALVARARVRHQWKRHELEALIAAIQRGGADFEALYAEMGLW